MQQTNSDRRTVPLPVGHIDAYGEMHTTAEVRPITGADEYRVGLSKEYTARPIDSVYEMLMLSRCVTKLGSRTQVTLSDIEQLHPDDLEVLKRAIHELTYKPPEPAEPPKAAEPPKPAEPAEPPARPAPTAPARRPTTAPTSTTSSTSSTSSTTVPPSKAAGKGAPAPRRRSTTTSTTTTVPRSKAASKTAPAPRPSTTTSTVPASAPPTPPAPGSGSGSEGDR